MDDARRQSHSLYNDKLTAIQQAKDTAEHDRERQLERMKEKIEQVHVIVLIFTLNCYTYHDKSAFCSKKVK